MTLMSGLCLRAVECMTHLIYTLTQMLKLRCLYTATAVRVLCSVASVRTDRKPFNRITGCLCLSEIAHSNITANKSHMPAILINEVEFNLILIYVYLQLNVYLLKSTWYEPV